MVEYMYKGTYDEDLSGDHSRLSFHAAMYAVAEKYRIKGLRAETITQYDKALRDETDIVATLESVAYVHSSTPEDARDLRDLIICFVRSRLMQSYSSSRAYGAFQRALDAAPSFSRDLVDSFMRHPSIGSCSSCSKGPFVDTEILQSRCKSCGRGGARSWPIESGNKETAHLM
jgi:speckle-type POZ protein